MLHKGGISSSAYWPLKLSLYVGIPSIALIAYILKKIKTSQEDAEFVNYENAFHNILDTLELKIPNNCVSRVIGPQGSVIKEIQRKTNTKIHFKDKASRQLDVNGNNSKTATEDSTVLIRGSGCDILKAEFEIKKIILDTSEILTEEYYVPEYSCGRIIGRGGQSIKEISTISNCRVKVKDAASSSENLLNSSSSATNPDATSDKKLKRESLTDSSNNSEIKKVVTLTGSLEQIELAKDLIIAKIKEEEAFREKKSKKNKSNFNRYNHSQQRQHRPKPIKKQPQQHISKRDLSSESITSSQSATETVVDVETKAISSSKRVSLLADQKMPDLISLEQYLDESSSIYVFVSAIAHPFAFWVQLADENAYLLDALVDNMTKYYLNPLELKDYEFANLDELKIGQLVACEYLSNEQDYKWRRAEIVQIINCPNECLIDVYFVDYGDSAYVNLSQLKILGGEFYELPLQGIECRLSGIEKAQDWSEELICHFEDVTHSCRWRRLKLKFVDYLEDSVKKPCVKLFNIKNNESISESLIYNFPDIVKQAK